MADKLRVLGFDPSLRNWGVAAGLYDLGAEELTITHLSIITPVLPKGKQVRQNSKDLEAAFQLAEQAQAALHEAQAIFVEVPVGSQSSRAMASYGICVGVLGALRARGIPFFEVTPTEVKLAAVNNKTATKSQMINWATTAHPEAPWPTQTQKGSTRIIEGKAEHMADAIATIYAGTRTPVFRQLSLLRA